MPESEVARLRRELGEQAQAAVTNVQELQQLAKKHRVPVEDAAMIALNVSGIAYGISSMAEVASASMLQVAVATSRH